MKISFDENECSKNGLSLTETLALAFIKQCAAERKNPNEFIQNLFDRKMIFENQPSTLFRGPVYYPMGDYDRKLQAIILDSDKSLPKDSSFEELAQQLQEFFPKGKMSGTKNTYYRGSYLTVAHHLKKWWKIYNFKNKYTFKDIIKATEKYASQFENDLTNMRTCAYFILKDDKRVDQDGKGYVEQISDLSVILENMNDDEQENSFIGF